jgi:CheY-like chemotaxis protein
MTNIICQENSIRDRFINNISTVVILEDMPEIRAEIKEFIENELGWQVIIAKNRSKAVEICEAQKAEFYIFDIKLGNEKDKSQEGIDTAEEIKRIDESVFVSILSGVPNLEPHKKMAERIGVNYFEEKGNVVREGVARIAVKMLFFKKGLVDDVFQKYLHSSAYLGNDEILKIVNKIKEVNKKLEDIQKIEKSYQSDSTVHPSDKPKLDSKLDEDENIREYKSRKQDLEWLQKYQDQYVTFADGNWLPEFIANDQEVLFEQLDQSEIYKDKPIFYAKLEKLDKVKESKNLPKLSRTAQFRAFKKTRN